MLSSGHPSGCDATVSGGARAVAGEVVLGLTLGVLLAVTGETPDVAGGFPVVADRIRWAFPTRRLALLTVTLARLAAPAFPPLRLRVASSLAAFARRARTFDRRQRRRFLLCTEVFISSAGLGIR